MIVPRRTVRLAGDQHLLAGVEKHLAKGSLVLADQTYTTKQLVKMIKRRIDKAKAVLAAQVALKDLVTEEESEIAQTKIFVDALRQALRAMFGTTASTLADFGLAPRKRRKERRKAK